MRLVARSLVTGVAVAGVLAGCSLLPLPTPSPVPVDRLPVGVDVTTAPDAMRLELNNGTSIVVVLSVNGGGGHDVGPGSVANLGMTELGPLPWLATVSTVRGRRLLELRVDAGSVSVSNEGGGRSSAGGRGARADLSCGRIDLWSGPPMLGPAPGPGTPGDCDP